MRCFLMVPQLRSAVGSVRGEHVARINSMQLREDLPVLGYPSGIAISDDAQLIAVSFESLNMIRVHRHRAHDHTAELLTEFHDPTVLSHPHKMAFVPGADRKLVVADKEKRRITEFGLSVAALPGAPVPVQGNALQVTRFLGEGILNEGICGLYCNGDVVVVGKDASSAPGKNRIVVLDYTTGALLRTFGNYGVRFDELGKYCYAVTLLPGSGNVACVTGDGYKKYKVSVFTADGAFVKAFGGQHLAVATDIHGCANGELIVVDAGSGVNTVWVFDTETGVVSNSWKLPTHGSGVQVTPRALAVVNDQAYVMDLSAALHVYE